jgi:hypothetical protein
MTTPTDKRAAQAALTIDGTTFDATDPAENRARVASIIAAAYADLHAQLAAKDEALAEARTTIAFFRSVILGGEWWSPANRLVAERTFAAIDAALEPKP